MNCPIDNSPMGFCFSELILDKYDGRYYRCPTCGFIQPENPKFWMEEAYSSAITATDIGLISRNILNISRLEPILYRLCEPDAKILDIGGGYGILCRGLRDRSFDCYMTDIYCENLFAKKYEPDLGFKADVLLAFEVLEHVANPVEFVEESFKKYSPDLMIFSTLTYDTEEPPNRDWWYYAFETGQHISIYHVDSIRKLGKKLGLHATSLGPELHALSTRPIAAIDLLLLDTRRKFVNRTYGFLIRFLRRQKSFLGADYEDAKADIRSAYKVGEQPRER